MNTTLYDYYEDCQIKYSVHVMNIKNKLKFLLNNLFACIRTISV